MSHLSSRGRGEGESKIGGSRRGEEFIYICFLEVSEYLLRCGSGILNSLGIGVDKDISAAVEEELTLEMESLRRRSGRMEWRKRKGRKGGGSVKG
jgi:hypothetical protein